MQFKLRRRQFIGLLGGAAAWPMAAGAQQAERMRRIGVLIGQAESDPEANAGFAAFVRGLSELGWTLGRNLRVDVRWAAANVERMHNHAKELVGLQPEVILTQTTPATAALQRATHTIPIVFTAVSDPIGEGFVESISRPGGNITGFTFLEASMAGKWLELLTEVAPDIKRVAIMFNPDTAPRRGSYFLPTFETAARLLKVEPIEAPVRSEAEIELIFASLGRERGGLVAMADNFLIVHRLTIMSSAAQNRVPTILPSIYYAKNGGLLSYAPDNLDFFRRSATYVDRILRGAKPAELPVQVPIKYVMAVNLKTAKALGLSVPQTLLSTADEVIE